MVKRTLSMLLAFSLVMSLLPVSVAAAETDVESTESAVLETAAETVPETTEQEAQSVPETIPETVPETVSETPPETPPETLPEETARPIPAAEEPLETLSAESSEERATVNATGTWILGEVKNLTMSPGGQEEPCHSFTFTAPQDGKYIIWWNEQEIRGYDPFVKIVNADDQQVGGGNAYAAFTGVKDVQYTITISACSSSSYDVVFHLDEVAPLQSIAFWDSVWEGYVGQSRWNRLSRTPENSDHGKITWTSSDDSVAVVSNPQGTACEVTLVGPGIATITATTSEGITATYQVIANELDAVNLTENETVTVGTTFGETKSFSFTPTESGNYAFWEVTGGAVWMFLSGQNVGMGHPGAVQGYLTAGVTYLITAQAWDDSLSELSIRTEKTTAATGFHFLDIDSHSGYVGEELYANLIYEPGNGQFENVTYTFSDPDAAEFTNSWSGGVGFVLKKAGTYTLTATSESGLTTSCTITAKEKNGTWELGETKNLTMQPTENNDPCYAYTFTAPKDGDYIVWWNEEEISGFDPFVQILDASGQHLGSGNVSAFFYGAEQGDQCTILISACSEQSYDAVFHLDELEPLQGIAFWDSDWEGYVGQSFWNRLSRTPGNANHGQITWTSSDESVAVVSDPQWSACEVTLVGPGEATITATAENGQTASYQVTAKSMQTWELGEAKNLTMQPQEKTYFEFTAPADGAYTLWCEEDLRDWPHIEVFDENGETVSLSWLRNSFPAQEGKTYRIFVLNYSGDVWNFTLHLDDAVPASTLWLGYNETTIPVGPEYGVDLQMDPGNADRTKVAWSVADPTVVEIVEGKQNDCRFRGLKAGDTTITVTDGYGHSDTLTIHVVAATELPEGETVTVDTEFGEEKLFTFIPGEDGDYVIRRVGGENSWMHLWGPDVDMWNYDWVQGYLYAGEIYTISAQTWDDTISQVSYIAEKTTTATGVHFQQAQYSGYVGDRIDAKLVYEPANGQYEDMEYTIEGDGAAELVDPWRVGTSLRLTKAGTFTLTATSESGLTASCTVTVEDAEIWALSETKTLDMHPSDNGSEEYVFQFTAPEDNGYIVWQEDGDWCWIDVFTSNGESTGVNGGGFIQFDATEGETYLIKLRSNYYEPTTDTFHLDTLTAATAIAPRFPEQANITAFSGDSTWLMLDFTPGNASRGQIAWTSDNPDSVEILNTSMDGCEVLMKEPGTATITAAHQRVEGVSTSFTIEVLSVGALEPDTPVSVTLAGHDNVSAFDFTAPEDAVYVIYDQTNQYGSVGVDSWTEEYGEEHYWGDNRVQFTARKDQTYRVTFHHWEDNEKTYSYLLTKAAPATEIRFNEESIQGFVGEMSWLNVSCEPANADLDGLTWHSSNEAVAVLDGENTTNRGIRLVGEGTAIITIRLGDLEASREVTVHGVTDINEGEDVNFSLYSWVDQGFRFTASESGPYTLWNESGAPFRVCLFDPEGYVIAEQDFTVPFVAEAGKTYMFKVINSTEEFHDYTFRVVKSVQATSISMAFDQEDVSVGDILGRPLNYAPVNAIPEDIIWTVEPADAAVIHQENYGFVYFEVLKEGTFTLTATTADGRLSASCTYNATVPPVITTDGIVATFPAHWVQSYQFTPTQSGRYTIRAESQEPLTLMVTDPVTKEVIEGGDVMHYDFTEGETYIIGVVNLNDHPVEATIHVESSVHAESANLRFLDLDIDRRPERVNAFPGESFYIELITDPYYAVRDDVTWTVSSEDVAQVLWSDEYGCDVAFQKAGTVTITDNVDGVEVSQTFTVTNPTTIQNGFTSGDVELTYGDRLGYRFTPTESGTYLFWDEYYAWTDILVCEENGNHIDFVSNFVQFDAEAGKSYLIIPRNINDTHVSAFRLEKCAEVTSITLSEQEFTGYIGEILGIDALFTPDNGYRNGLSWQVDNEEVIQIRNSYSSRAEVLLVGTGTATVTATVGNLSASCTVTVNAYDAIQLGDVRELSMEWGDKAGFAFTPEESGTYVIWDESQVYAYYELYDTDGNFLMNAGGERLVFDAEAGQTYRILVYSYRKINRTFHLDTTAKAVGLTIEKGVTIYEYVDQEIVLFANANPGNGMLGALAWTSSNPEVLEIREYDPNDTSCYFYTKGVGESTLTVRDTKNGLENSVLVVIRAMQPMTLGKSVYVSQETTESYSCMTFTPETDGTYVLTADTDASVQTWVYTRQTGLLAKEVLDRTQKELQLELKAGTTYYVETMLHDAEGNVITGSYSLTLSQPGAQAPVAILSQPADYVGALNSTASFTVAVNREDVTYRWYFSNDGVTWKESYSTGYNTDTLTVQLTATRLGQQYRCEITDSEGNTVVSDAATMRMPPSTIQILTQPDDYYGAEADAAPFTVEATGDGLTYRWYYSIGGETWAVSYSDGYDTPTLTPVLRSYNSGRMFRCLITDVNGNTEWTNAVTMALASSDITIVTQPVSYTGAVNDLTEFTVEATGTNLTYQWYFSKDNGATWEMSYNEGYDTASMKVRLYAYRSGYQYKCEISSGSSVKVETDVVTIALRAATAVINQHPLDAGGEEGTNAIFNVVATGNGLSYQWQFSKDNGETWGNTYLTGATTQTLTVEVLAYRDGWQYRCVVTDDSGLSVTTKAATLHVGAAPVITGQPESYSGAVGGTATFTVTAEGANLTYQWQYSNNGGSTWANSGAAGATTASIDVAALAYRNGQMYRCVVTNEYGSVISDAASLTIG